MHVQGLGKGSVVPWLCTTFCVLAAFLLLGDVVLGTRVNQKMLVQTRGKRQAGSRQEHNTSVDPSLLMFTPATPSPEQVNCYVEIPVTRRVGGRCVLLGSSTWGCQAGLFLAINSQCQHEVRSPAGDQPQAGSSNSTRGGTRPRNPFRRPRRPN
ncbi:unnamed protein product [Candidula unifasciata]|uniref:Uncharacterized protein n=1 Tax=Candidula unifasciata TaxID=100452 RepID=A0A8S3YN65_9EUPU|nr:unnamed protein product [Candidula unifasciata]